ncbi:MAG: hypothetical protein JWO62_2598 [Acidimicrobiaceae bacterium]|nr:hypothetical protein [Acidimicrobiaceae bacterium]
MRAYPLAMADPAVESDVEGVIVAHRALELALADLDDATARQGSRLPGWTVGHVVTHLARNADSLVRVLDAAADGRISAQYPEGMAGRDADIEKGADRPALELLADLFASDQRLGAALADTSDEVWEAGRALRHDVEVRLASVPLRRWQEVEVHRVDLGLDYEAVDWPERFVTRQLDLMLPGLAGRLPRGVAIDLRRDGEAAVIGSGPDPLLVERPPHELLHWLFGRSDDRALPPLGSW